MLTLLPFVSDTLIPAAAAAGRGEKWTFQIAMSGWDVSLKHASSVHPGPTLTIKRSDQTPCTLSVSACPRIELLILPEIGMELRRFIGK